MLIFGYVGSETKKNVREMMIHKHQFHQSRLGGKPQTSKKTTGRNPLSRTRVAASKGSQVMIRAAGWYVQDFHSWQQMVRGKSEKQ